MKKFVIFLSTVLAAISSCSNDAGEYQVNPVDGKKMVLIPGGTYRMGSESGYAEEKPVHKVKVNSFWMDVTEVTNAEYKAFCDATGRKYPVSPRWKNLPDEFLTCPDHPVVNVSWDDAAEYAAWSGKRLPSEQEWEWAARGGLKGAQYPWGDGTPDGTQANFADKNSELQWKDFGSDDGFQYSAPVGSYKPNGYGLYDMSGNVCEWVEEWFFPYTDKKRSMEGFDDGWGGYKVCRGGCYHSPDKDITVSRRRQVLAGDLNNSVGFRCVKDTGAAGPMGKVVDETSTENLDKLIMSMNISITPGNELCVSGGFRTTDPDLLAKYKSMGATSIEQYVPWESCENAGEGQWDFSYWDSEVEKIRAAGLKWVPFVIAGPAYSLPDWYRESNEFTGFRCLEHNIESKVQTLWDPGFRKYVELWIKAFAEHFKDSDILEGVLFGITGDFGEAIVPVYHGNWPQTIPGVYHDHAGYWCNDRFARENFKEFFKERFGGDIDSLNESWGTSFRNFASIEFPPVKVNPESFRIDEDGEPGTYIPSNAAQRRRWIDFVDWYRSSMTEYTSFWMHTGRKYFPDTELYLCTGGDAVPWHASEFAQQCKVCAEVGGGVRITNEASSYTNNFNITNWVSSASHFYHSYFSFEPAGHVNERGSMARVYNASAVGAKSILITDETMQTERKIRNFAANAHWMKEGDVNRKIAVMYPDTPLMLNTERYKEMNAAFTMLRDYTDFAYACDLTIEDGILDTVEALIICLDGYYKTATLEKIREFAAKGGILIGIGLQKLRDMDNDEDYFDILFKEGKHSRTLLIDGMLGGKVEQTSTPSNYKVVLEEKSEVQEKVFNPVTDFLKDCGLHVEDGILDDVFVTDRCGSILVFNNSGKDVTRTFTFYNGETVRADVPDLAIMEFEY